MQKTLKETIKITREKLSKIYFEDSQLEASVYWIMEYATGLNLTQILINQNKIISDKEFKKIEEILDLHVNKNMPLQYIFQKIPFLDLEIKVEQPILIPRPETEYWVQEIINKFQNFKDYNLKILDLCTGTGCIALSLAKYFKNSHIWAIDINQKACDLTIQNAKSNNIKNITVLNSNLFENLEKNLKFDLILSNPPYISLDEWKNLDQSVKNWEDKIALVAHDDGLELISKIIFQAKNWLNYNNNFNKLNLPQIVIEIGYKQAADVIKIFQENNFIDIKVHKDLFSKDRFVTAGVSRGAIF